jgi:hypothetical protein
MKDPRTVRLEVAGLGPHLFCGFDFFFAICSPMVNANIPAEPSTRLGPDFFLNRAEFSEARASHSQPAPG